LYDIIGLDERLSERRRRWNDTATGLAHAVEREEKTGGREPSDFKVSSTRETDILCESRT
jgi:hypothetical protein